MINGLKIWPPERTQDFSKIWPSDLVLTTIWLIFELFENSSRHKLWPSFMTIGWLIDWMVFYATFNSISVISRRQFTFMLSWVSPVLGSALKYLAQGHSHENQRIQWGSNPGPLDYESNTLPLSHVGAHDNRTEYVPSRAYTRLFKIWPSDLVFDPTWPVFILGRDFIKTNILTKFHDNQTESVASRAYTRFF